MIRLPAETIVRMCRVSPLLRFDNGLLVSTDRQFLAVENIGGDWQGIHDVQIDDATLVQCETETQFHSSVEILPNDALRYTCVKTTMGYVSGNIRAEDVDYLDRWRAVIGRCATPLTESRGAMVWSAEAVGKLAAAAPSGVIVFEEHIDVRERPALVRDANLYEWCGCFMGHVDDGKYHGPATLPGWLR